MANNSKYVTAGKPKIGGAIYTAPMGTVLPTNACSILSDDWKNLGYISEDGLTNSNSKDSENVKAWGGDVVLTLFTEVTDTFAFSMLETMNEDVIKFRYGADNVSGSGTEDDNLVVRANATDTESVSIVVDMLLRDGAKKRVVIPMGKISETEDITYVDGEAVAYGVTVTALPGYEDGDTHKEYIIYAQGGGDDPDVSE